MSRRNQGDKQTASQHHTIRLEQVIARRRDGSLAGEMLKPDPLQMFAKAFEELREDLGDQARVAIDLVPLSRRRRRAFRNKVRSAGDRAARSSNGGMLEDLAAMANLPGGSSSAERVEQTKQTKRLRDREDDIHLFDIQVLIEISSEIKGRPQNLLPGFLAAFDQFESDNAHWRASGLPLFGKFFFGSDWWPRRKWFDLRMKYGYVAPAGRNNVVAPREISGLIKPPSKHCDALGVVRTPGDVAPAPRNVARYRRRKGVFPFGMAGGEMIGMSIDEMFFGYLSGRSRFGKTELALNQLLHVALVEQQGAFFLDPHRDAIQRVKEYLANPLTMDRVIELDFSNNDPSARHVAWNPLSMEGRTAADIAERAQAIVDAATVVQKWGSTASRIPIITGQAAASMLHIALQLPPDLAPTLFTMVRFLSDDEWRAQAVTKLPPYLQHYWNKTFVSYSGDATGPLVNMITKFERSEVARAILGSPRSTYDARKAMDSGAVVLACPGSNMEASMASFIVFDLLNAAKSRAGMDVAKRELFYAFLDELQSYDDGRVVPSCMEECAKYGLRVIALNQSPHRLTQRTLDAISTNSSFLVTTSTSAEGAQYFDRQWADAGAKGLVAKLPRYNYLASITHGEARSAPFRLAGLPIDQIWKHQGDITIPNPEAVGQLEASMDRRMRPKTVRETLKEISGHDDRVLQALLSGNYKPPPPEPASIAEEVESWLAGLEDAEPPAPPIDGGGPNEDDEPPADDDSDDDFDVRFG